MRDSPEVTLCGGQDVKIQEIAECAGSHLSARPKSSSRMHEVSDGTRHDVFFVSFFFPIESNFNGSKALTLLVHAGLHGV